MTVRMNRAGIGLPLLPPLSGCNRSIWLAEEAFVAKAALTGWARE